MKGAIRFLLLLSAAAVALVAAPRPAAAQTDSILAQVGGDLAGTAGFVLDVPITVDLRGAPGRALGGYRARLAWDPTVLGFNGLSGDGFAAPTSASDSAYSDGVLRFTALLPAGASGVVQIATVQFYVYTDTAPTPVTLTFDDLTASAGSVTPFEDLLPLLRVVNGTFCRALGLWGDVDADGRANSRDALAALSAVVGLPTPGMTVSLADVDADGGVTSRDALIILSYAVGLPVPGFRVMLPAAGACGTGAARTLVVRPDTIDVVPGQVAYVVPELRDAAGRAVPATSVSWSSDNGLVAGVFIGGGEAPPAPLGVSRSAAWFGPVPIEGRMPGVARLTATAGPGVSGTLVVRVAPRRSTWYADVGRARNTVTQLGTMQYPMEFIGGAARWASNGDTIRVAGGVYEEVVSIDRAVTVLGDSLDRPVVDPRGAPYYNDQALWLGDVAGRVELAHLVIRYGGIALGGVDNVVRDVRMEDIARYSALEVYGTFDVARGRYGNTLIDNVQIMHHAERGIYVYEADTVTVRNSTLVGDSIPESCYVGSSTNAGILVEYASRVMVVDNDVGGSRCMGIGAYADTGRVSISRNHVWLAGSTGIAAAARVVSFDHNRVERVGLDGYSYSNNAGLYVTNEADVDSVLVRGDSVRNAAGYYTFGVFVDTANVVLVDSVVIDSVGLNPSAYEGHGVEARAGRFVVSDSRISHTRSNGVSAESQYQLVGSLHNRYMDIGQTAFQVYLSCDCSGYSADSAVSLGDSVWTAGMGVGIYWTATVLVDSLVVDSAQTGVEVEYVDHLRLQNSHTGRTATGVLLSGANDARLWNNLIERATYALQVWNYGAVDTVRVGGGTITSSTTGAAVYAGALLVDSALVSGNGTGVLVGINTQGRVQRTRFASNTIGMRSDTYDGASVAHSNFMGNPLAGLLNTADITMDADSNFWNDARGPACAGAAVGCDPASVGDSVSGDIAFLPFDAASVPTPVAPPPGVALVRSGATPRGPIAAPGQRPERVARRPAAQATGSSARRPPSIRSPATERRPARPQPWHRATPPGSASEAGRR